MEGVRRVTPGDALERQQVTNLISMPTSQKTANFQKIVMQTFQRLQSPLTMILQQSSIPAWQGFMEKITSGEFYEKSNQGGTSICQQSTDRLQSYTNCIVLLSYAIEESKKTKQQTCLVTVDQPQYESQDIVALENNSEMSLFISSFDWRSYSSLGNCVCPCLGSTYSFRACIC